MEAMRGDISAVAKAPSRMDSQSTLRFHMMSELS